MKTDTTSTFMTLISVEELARLRALNVELLGALSAAAAKEDGGVMKSVTTTSALETAHRWLDASIERSLKLERTVSGEGEHAEILMTIKTEIESLYALNAELLALLTSAPEPTSERAWVLSYVEWHKKARAVIAKA